MVDANKHGRLHDQNMVLLVVGLCLLILALNKIIYTNTYNAQHSNLEVPDYNTMVTEWWHIYIIRAKIPWYISIKRGRLQPR